MNPIASITYKNIEIHQKNLTFLLPQSITMHCNEMGLIKLN